MARKLDMIIFGATGFTGKRMIPVINKFSKTKHLNLTWGIAGRNKQKMENVLDSYKNEIKDVNVHVEIADVSDYESLNTMASKARIVLNCCGPYRFFGEPVVRACIEQGTHLVDVSGEPQYMEEIQLEYHKKAQEKGVYIVSSCGVDSIPTDMGIVFLQQKFMGQLNSVETYLSSWEEDNPSPGPSMTYTTWESAVHGLAHSEELKKLRRKLFPTRLPRLEPRLKAKKFPHKFEGADGWAVPFLGADRSVAVRSQRFFNEVESKRPLQVETYVTIKSFFNLLQYGAVGSVIGTLSKYEFGQNLLLKYPEMFTAGMFSKEQQPSEEKIQKSWFSVTLYGKGWKDSTKIENNNRPTDSYIIGKVKGRNPAYGTTCTTMVLAAITILTERDKLPSCGGVYSPGAAFAKTSLIERLHDNGVTFEILEENYKTSLKAKL